MGLRVPERTERRGLDEIRTPWKETEREMSDFVQRINQNSGRFIPAFVRVHFAEEGRAGRFSEFDFHFFGPHPTAADGERELNRWVVYGGGTFVATDAGEPFGQSGGSGRMLQLFTGGAEVLLTERRLLAIVIDGETIVGPVGGRSGHMLLLSFPLNLIESVGVDRKPRMFGGVKETRLQIMSVTFSPAALVFDDVIAESGPGPRGFQRFRGTKRDIVEAFVRPVIAARRPDADANDERQLQAVERGRRIDGPDEYAATFVAD
jgi:hypothetical protein